MMQLHPRHGWDLRGAGSGGPAGVWLAIASVPIAVALAVLGPAREPA